MIGVYCSICSIEFAPGDKVLVLPCHETHMLHIECYEELSKFAREKRQPLTCPICRKEVEEDKIVKKELIEADVNVEVYSPFALSGYKLPDNLEKDIAEVYDSTESKKTNKVQNTDIKMPATNSAHQGSI